MQIGGRKHIIMIRKKNYLSVNSIEPYYERYFAVRFLYHLSELRKDPQDRLLDDQESFDKFYDRITYQDPSLRSTGIILGVAIVSAWEIPLEMLRKINYLGFNYRDLWDHIGDAHRMHSFLNTTPDLYQERILKAVGNGVDLYCKQRIENILQQGGINYVLRFHSNPYYAIDHKKFSTSVSIDLTYGKADNWIMQPHVGFANLHPDSIPKGLKHDLLVRMKRTLKKNVDELQHQKRVGSLEKSDVFLSVNTYQDINDLVQKLIEDDTFPFDE